MNEIEEKSDIEKSETSDNIIVAPIDDIDKLYLHDFIRFHLMSAKLECEHNRDAFWRTYRKLKTKNNWISVPLLFVSSATGITSISSLSQVNILSNKLEVAPILAGIFGVSTTVLSGLQKYFRYSERAENCRYVAKSYSRLSNKIKNIMMLIHSDCIKITPTGLYKFLDDVNKEMISLSREIEEQPAELIKARTEHIKASKDLKDFYIKNYPAKGTQPTEIPMSLADIEI